MVTQEIEKKIETMAKHTMTKEQANILNSFSQVWFNLQ